MKIKFFEKKVVRDYLKTISILNSIIAFIFLFLPELSCCTKLWIFLGFVFILIAIYIIIYLYHKNTKHVYLKINNTIVNIFFGDLFESKGMKVIAFNEYFDTLVDDDIIAKKSLNGQIVNNVGKGNIDESINKDIRLKIIEVNKNRKKGNKNKYQLGSIHKYKDYFLLAFTHFNFSNEAELFSTEYAKCLLEMWKELNTQYAQEEIFIPLLGGGITRILDNRNAEEQELLEIMLNTLEISKFTFKKPSKINIVLYNDKDNAGYKKYNFAKIKQLFK